MYRGQVTAVDAKGVYVLVPSLHPTAAFGPLDHVGARPAVGARVLVADCGDESAPDLVVMTGGVQTSSTDNAVARFDGTGGALQGSGVTIGDDSRIRIASTAAGYLVIGNTGSGHASAVECHTGDGSTTASRRWWFGKGQAAETGGNAGSDFFISRYDDSGNGLGSPVTIKRSTGRIIIGAAGATAGLEFGAGGPRDMSGAGSPEGVVTAPKGSTWRRTDGGAGTTFWVKESGTGDTGWIAK